ncbi:hypothetical protein AA0535_1063 [Asaia krungthepensis NRIC 0535]|uniref:Uncharacterized protein n=1 Tax=Asaia krungthepensis NRIC 0535 TaxID=1307925 RepID=A0ABQ0Q170_9PROT|nr:hypothetical protein AA0535_1063 [Asaia krungthepensis NRIC 0535]
MLVGKMTLFDSDHTLAIATHCEADVLDGWGDAGEPNARWTTGNAILPLGERIIAGPGVLSIEVLSDGPFLALD